MSATWDFPNLEKNKISSNLLINSGLNLDLTTFITLFITDLVFSFFSLKFKLLSKYSEPILLVIIIIVFVKSTVFPWLSVKRPSSITCNNKFKTSKCAFSISSKSITLYGLLITASVNTPPSS